ncbi:MAG: hypothetical protein HFE63_01080 [Clostridiales bacterium]|nr:hypothetical protein [Clostridiales bacterium]
MMEFRELESKAYNGEYVGLDSMPPVEYKYFARIAALGRDFRAGKYQSAAEVANIRNSYYAEYERDKAGMKWTDAVKITDSLRVHINGESDPVMLAALALRAVWLMTGDTMIEKKMHEVEDLK